MNLFTLCPLPWPAQPGDLHVIHALKTMNDSLCCCCARVCVYVCVCVSWKCKTIAGLGTINDFGFASRYSVLFHFVLFALAWNLFEFWALLWVYNQCQLISSRSNHKILYVSLDIYLSGLSWLVRGGANKLSPSTSPFSDIKLSSEELIECQGCAYASYATHWFPHLTQHSVVN